VLSTTFFETGQPLGLGPFASKPLGAKGTLIGRAFLYGLGAAGQAGVTRTLEILHTELDRTMALCGRTNLAEVDRSILLE